MFEKLRMSLQVCRRIKDSLVIIMTQTRKNLVRIRTNRILLCHKDKSPFISIGNEHIKNNKQNGKVPQV